jgi:hypothetical protein
MLRLRGSKWFFTQMTHAQPLYFSRRILPKGEDDVKLYWQLFRFGIRTLTVIRQADCVSAEIFFAPSRPLR